MTELERQVSDELRREALVEVQRRGLDASGLALALDVFPDGARRLLKQEAWSVNQCLKVLSALGSNVRVTVAHDR